MGKYRVTFAGDFSMGDGYFSKKKVNQEELNHRLENDPESFIKNLKKYVCSSDFFVLNFESVLSNEEPKILLEDKPYPNWDNPERTIKVLKELGVDAVGLSNNHTMDFGKELMISTKQLLERADINCFGAGENSQEASKPYKITLNGKNNNLNIYVIAGMRCDKRYRSPDRWGFTAKDSKAGVYALGEKTISNQIMSIKKEDPESKVIVYSHWQGTDYTWASDRERIRNRCRVFIDAGADYIIGHGSHLLDKIERYNDGLIVYSVGNFMFNSTGKFRETKALPYGLVASIDFEEVNNRWVCKEYFYPIVTDNRKTKYKVRGINEDEVNDLVEKLNEKNEHIKDMVVSNIDENGYYIQIPEKRLTKKKTNIANEHFVEEKAFLKKLNLKEKKMNYYEKSFFETGRDSIKKAFDKQGLKTFVIDRYLGVKIENRYLFFNNFLSSMTGYYAASISSNKDMAKEYLKDNGIKVARGEYFSKNQKDEAKNYALMIKKAVIKPRRGIKGRGVTVGVTTEKEFVDAWTNIKEFPSGVIVEEQFKGVEARFLVVGGKTISVIQKITPSIEGNGKDTIKELIDKKNDVKKNNPHLKDMLFKVDKYREHILDKQGFELNSIPKEGELVILDPKSSISEGADTIDITNDVHEKFKFIAEKAVDSIPGLKNAGVDIMAKD